MATTTVSKSDSIALLSAATAVSIWGTFTLIVALALDAGVDVFALSFSVQLSIAAILVLTSICKPKEFKTFVSNKDLPWVAILVSSTLFILRDVGFIYALSIIPKMHVTVIDALWPVFTYIISGLAVRSTINDFTVRKVLLMVSAFIGASLTLFINDFSNEVEEIHRQISTAYLGYISAILGALFASGEVVSAQYIHGKSKFSPTKQNTHYLSTSQRAPSIVFVFCISYYCGIDYQSVHLGWEYVLYLSVGWVIATVLFNFAAITHSSNSFVSIAYFSPVMTAVLLMLFYPKETIGIAAIGAMLTIVFSNYFMHFARRSISATALTSVLTLLTAVVCTVIDARQANGGIGEFLLVGETNLLIYIQIFAEIFAILVGFTLLRLHNRDRELELGLSEIGTRLYSLTRTLDGDKKFDRAARRRINSLSESVLASAIDCRQRITNAAAGAVSGVYSMTERLGDELNGICPEGKQDIKDKYERAIEAVDSWMILFTDRPSVAEIAAVYTMGILLVFGMLLARVQDVFSNIATVSFAMAIVFLLSAVGDLLRNQTQRKFTQLMAVQRLFIRLNGTYYIPKRLLDVEDFPDPEKIIEVRHKWTSEGVLSEDTLKIGPTGYAVKKIPVLLTYLALIVSFLLVSLAER